MTTCFLGSYFKTFFCYSQKNHVISYQSYFYSFRSKYVIFLEYLRAQQPVKSHSGVEWGDFCV